MHSVFKWVTNKQTWPAIVHFLFPAKRKPCTNVPTHCPPKQFIRVQGICTFTLQNSPWCWFIWIILITCCHLDPPLSIHGSHGCHLTHFQTDLKPIRLRCKDTAHAGPPHSCCRGGSLYTTSFQPVALLFLETSVLSPLYNHPKFRQKYKEVSNEGCCCGMFRCQNRGVES